MAKKNKHIVCIAIAVLIIFIAVLSAKTSDNNRMINAAGGCMNEGEYGLKACCNLGMTQISCASVSGPFKCMIAGCGSVCTYCGNGVCGDGENWCNCPKDCPRFSF